MLLDTHAHLDYPEFADDIDGILARAEDSGVTRIVAIGTDLESSRNCLVLAERYPQIYAAVGVHPNCMPESREEDIIAPLRELCAHPKAVAIGEIGTDHYRLPGAKLRKNGTRVMEALGAGSPAAFQAEILDDAYKADQAERFVQQLELAAELGMNVVVHQRDSFTDTLDLIRPFTGKLRAVFHCFGGSPEQAQEVIDLGHLVSFTGVVTFKNAAIVRETAASVPADSFMVETDCPYLAPVPHRGKRCEPAFTRLIAETIATERNVELEELATQTTRTAEKFFGL